MKRAKRSIPTLWATVYFVPVFSFFLNKETQKLRQIKNSREGKWATVYCHGHHCSSHNQCRSLSLKTESRHASNCFRSPGYHQCITANKNHTHICAEVRVSDWLNLHVLPQKALLICVQTELLVDLASLVSILIEDMWGDHSVAIVNLMKPVSPRSASLRIVRYKPLTFQMILSLF